MVEKYNWILSLVLQSFIAYHVFYLSKRLTNKAKLKHKENIKNKADKIIYEIHTKKLRSKVYLVNIDRYFKDYPANKEKKFSGYSHIEAEIKSTRFDGIEFFAEMPREIYRRSDGKLSFKNKNYKDEGIVFPVGLVPYEWIEYIDEDGDEYAYLPLIYCHYRGRIYWKFIKKFLFFGYPYKRLSYYKLSEVYHEHNDPPGMKYQLIQEKIYNR